MLEDKDDPTLLRKDDYYKANILQKQFYSLYQEPDGEVPFFAERNNGFKNCTSQEIWFQLKYLSLIKADPLAN